MGNKRVILNPKAELATSGISENGLYDIYKNPITSAGFNFSNKLLGADKLPTVGANTYNWQSSMKAMTAADINSDGRDEVVVAAFPTIDATTMKFQLIIMDANAGFGMDSNISSSISTTTQFGGSVPNAPESGYNFSWKLVGYNYDIPAGDTTQRALVISYLVKDVVAPPAVPNNLKLVSTSGTAAKIQWDSVTGANGYQILRSNTENGTYKLVGNVDKATLSFTDTILVPNYQYFYKIVAYDISLRLGKPTIPLAVKLAMVDFNNDGKISISDLNTLVTKYNTKESDTNWQSKYDLNADGVVDIFDMVIESKEVKK